MRFATLGSGSAGNVTVVACGDEMLLVDGGLSARQVEQRLDRLGCDPGAVTAVVVTHEHDDHIGGAAAFSTRHRVPVHVTPGTRLGAGPRLDKAHAVVEFAPEGSFAIGSFTLFPAIVPHDAREPCQFIVEANGLRLGILTDLGSVTQHLLRHFRELDGLVLEFNHDPGMLADGPYPPSLRERIAGRYGHLSNAQADALLGRLDHDGLQHVVAAHLSEKTNRPELVGKLLERRRPATASWSIATQHDPLDWHELERR